MGTEHTADFPKPIDWQPNQNSEFPHPSDSRIWDLQDLIRYGSDEENELAKIDLTNLPAEGRQIKNPETGMNSFRFKARVNYGALMNTMDKIGMERQLRITSSMLTGTLVGIGISPFTDSHPETTLFLITPALLLIYCALKITKKNGACV